MNNDLWGVEPWSGSIFLTLKPSQGSIPLFPHKFYYFKAFMPLCFVVTHGGNKCFAFMELSLGAAHLFPLKTVHRTVFLTLKPSQGSIPLFPHKSFIKYRHLLCLCKLCGDSWGNRTPVAGVRGRSLNRLTNEPFKTYKGYRSFHSPCIWCTIRGSNPGHPD